MRLVFVVLAIAALGDLVARAPPARIRVVDTMPAARASSFIRTDAQSCDEAWRAQLSGSAAVLYAPAACGPAGSRYPALGGIGLVWAPSAASVGRLARPLITAF